MVIVQPLDKPMHDMLFRHDTLSQSIMLTKGAPEILLYKCDSVIKSDGTLSAITPEIAKRINGITRDGDKCTSFAECAEMLADGADIDYDGPSGPQSFGPQGEPTEATFAIFSYDANNKIDGEIAPQFRAAKI